MTNAISCPSCHTEIEISEVLQSQLTEKIRIELEAEVALKQAEFDTQEKQLDQERVALKTSQESVDERVRTGIEAQREVLTSEANKRAAEALAVEIQDRDPGPADRILWPIEMGWWFSSALFRLGDVRSRLEFCNLANEHRQTKA